MPLGIDQFNTFDTFSLHCRKDRVYHAGKEFPAGHFAAEILNFAGEIHDPLLERISTLTTPVGDAVSTEKEKSRELLAELRPLMKDAVSWIYTCPPFCYQENQNEWSPLNWQWMRSGLNRTVTHLRRIYRIFSFHLAKRF